MKKYNNTVIIRKSATVEGGIEILFAEKPSGKYGETVREKLQGRKNDLDGWKFMTFKWHPTKKYWYAKEKAMLNRQLAKLIEEMVAHNYKVNDERNAKVKAVKKTETKTEAKAKPIKVVDRPMKVTSKEDIIREILNQNQRLIEMLG